MLRRVVTVVVLALTACGGSTSPSPSSSSSSTPTPTPAASSTATPTTCTLTASTTPTTTTSPTGCAVLERDTSACRAAREAAGLSGFWLRFSCRVTLTATTDAVTAVFDGQPDYTSNYFPVSNACHETYDGGIQNPNWIATKAYAVAIRRAPDDTATKQNGAVMGVALNGVPMFSNFAAPGDDIYREAATFDRCNAHPTPTGAYHYHSEPYALSYDDGNFIGVLRDGYPVYGRKDPDGSYPTLDAYGGHTGATLDSTAPVYHYHVNQQTSTAPSSVGEKEWFIMTGTFRGSVVGCSTCN